MGRIKRKDQPIKKSPAISCRSCKQTIKCRSQPNDANMIGKMLCRSDRRTIDAVTPLTCAILVLNFKPCAKPPEIFVIINGY
jgi:hypothetical protein